MTILLFFFVFFTALAVHPYVSYPLSLHMIMRAPRGRRRAERARPTLAICMCAYNEAAVIVAKAEALLSMAAHYGPAEIYVYVDGSEDETAALLAPYADRIHLNLSPLRHGKTYGMKQLSMASDSELLAFTDANVITPVDALEKLVAALDEPDVCCASARLRYSNAELSDTAAVGAVYWSLEETIKGLESDRTGLVGVDGALFVIERSAYPDVPDHLIDDLYVSLSVLISGKRVVTAPEVLVEERGAVRWREEFRRKARIACQAWNVHRTLWPQLRRMPLVRLYAYLSHRVLKWLTPFTLPLAGGCLALLILFFIGPLLFWLAAGAVLAIFGVALLLQVRMATFIGMALVSLAGVGVGVLESIFAKRTYTVWTPAESVRSDD